MNIFIHDIFIYFVYVLARRSTSSYYLSSKEIGRLETYKIILKSQEQYKL